MKTTYMMNIIRNRINGVVLLLGATMLIAAGCQRESLAPESGVRYDCKISYAPGVAGIGSANGSGVKSVLSDGSAVIGSGSLTLRSADGRFTIPMSLTVTGAQAADVTSGAPTKSTLINEKGGITASDFATAISNTFWVAAWSDDATPVQIIPDAAAKAFPGGYVSANKEYQKVVYRTKSVAGNDLTTPYWMTMQPQISAYSGDADDEYIWKSSEDMKTFYAYANVPAGTTVALLAEGAGQTLTCTGVPSQDILMGYYYGDGSTVSSEDRTGTASIHFYHPLTAVKFLAGDLADGAEITGISIENVYGGSTEFKVTQEGTNFTWAKSDGPLGASDATSDVSVSLSTDEADNPVLLIPQKFSAASKSRICVTIAQGGETFNVYATLDDATWNAGYINTYTIGYNPPEEDEPLPGKFSISAMEYAQFSRGNLFCTRSGSEGSYTYRFGFESHQYDYHSRPGYQSVQRGVYSETGTGVNESGMFLWDYDNAAENKDFGAFGTSSSLGGTAEDAIEWGQAMSTEGWMTLTHSELDYLLHQRPSAVNLHKWATVNGVAGLILAPDGYEGTLQEVYSGTSTPLTWAQAETAGLVFLPSTGCVDYRTGEQMCEPQNVYLWCSDVHSDTNTELNGLAHNLWATPNPAAESSDLNVIYVSRTYAISVRLVKKSAKPEKPVLYSGRFSTSNTEYVLFSRGNLFCTRSTESGPYTFSFEKEQYMSRTRYGLVQYPDNRSSGITMDNTTPPNTSGLFQWNTDATSGDYGAFGTSQSVTSSVMEMDWGPAVGSEWTTLSISDMDYLLSKRGGTMYAKATVCGVAGLLIFPDGWSNPNGWTITAANTPDVAYSSNVIPLSGTPCWQNFEDEGIVFLPAAGCMASAGSETDVAFVGVVGSIGDYWSRNAGDNSNSQYLTVTSTWVSLETNHNRDYGRAVRLVKKFSKDVKYVEIEAKYDGTNLSTLKWATENLAITGSGMKEWKGTGHIVGDFFQWGAYAGYCGSATDLDKGLVLYQSFTCKGCDDAEPDKFYMKDGKRFNTACAPFNKGTSPYTYLEYTAAPATLASEHDVANIVLGGKWRMPTTGEIVAMRDATYWVWDETDKGYYICLPSGTCEAGGKGKTFPPGTDKSGALLFIPASGFVKYGSAGNQFLQSAKVCNIWTSSLAETNKAYNLYFGGTGADPTGILPGYSNYRYYGFSIRPVADE